MEIPLEPSQKIPLDKLLRLHSVNSCRKTGQKPPESTPEGKQAASKASEIIWRKTRKKTWHKNSEIIRQAQGKRTYPRNRPAYRGGNPSVAVMKCKVGQSGSVAKNLAFVQNH